MLLDVRHYTRGSAAPLSSTHSLIEMLRSHYPERLHYAVLIEPTWIMKMVGRVVRATLVRRTHKEGHTRRDSTAS